MKIYSVIELDNDGEINSLVHTTVEQEAISMFEQIISEVSEDDICYWIDLKRLNKLVMRHWVNTYDKFSCILTRQEVY